jgi:hypothetical protein
MALNPYVGNPSQRTEIKQTEKTQANPNTAARIWNVFKANIVLDELSLLQTGSSTAKNKNEDNASMAYPLIKINDYIFAPEEINNVTIDSTGFLPMINLTVTTLSKLFVSKSMPKDGDIISIMIRNKNDVLNPIRNDYVITGVPSKAISTNNKLPTTMTFFGELFVPGLKSYLGSASFRGTSMEVMKSIAEILELGFNTNDTETSDEQIWLAPNSPDEFIKDVAYKSWKEENSFFDVWIDVYYNLNFVNVQKILLAPEEEIDPAVFLGNLDIEFIWGSASEQEEAVQYPKVLSNLVSYRTSSNYITSWKPVNRSSAITFEYGTSMDCSFYEHLNILYSNPDSKKYWELEIAPDYDPTKIDSHILLRGRAHWDASLNQGGRAQANYSYKELYRRSPWLGIQYTLTNPEEAPNMWSGNHHPNYMRAQVHNLVNLIELDKLNLEVSVKGTNANIIKGDKLPVVLIQGDMHEAQMANPDQMPLQAVDFFYTGWYFVKGFTLSWSKNRDQMTSSFAQTYVLTRREWTPPEPVDPIRPVEPKNNPNVS